MDAGCGIWGRTDPYKAGANETAVMPNREKSLADAITPIGDAQIDQSLAAVVAAATLLSDHPPPPEPGVAFRHNHIVVDLFGPAQRIAHCAFVGASVRYLGLPDPLPFRFHIGKRLDSAL